MKAHFQEYCTNTSIHGLKYVGEAQRSCIERLCWAVAFVLSVCACAHLIRNQWSKWESSPVIVSFAETTTPIWQIPFPAVTICSETKFRQTLYNFTDVYQQYRLGRYAEEPLTEEEKFEFESNSLVCNNNLQINGTLKVKEEDLSLLEEVSQPLDEMIAAFYFKNKKVEAPEEKFIPILTDEGVCYTFNMLNSNEIFTDEVTNYATQHMFSDKRSTWHVESGYSEAAEVKRSYPRRAMGSGITAGFTISLETRNRDLDYVCRGPVQGFKIILHNPGETPRVGNQYFRAPLNQEMTVAVRPAMITTSDGLHQYSAVRRQCFFPSERKLRFFRDYTQNNCALECVTNYTRRQCDCVSLSMPRIEGVELCGPGSRDCMAMAATSMLKNEVEKSWQQTQQRSPGGAGGTLAQGCDCRPACTDLQYDAETSQADYVDPKDHAQEYGLEVDDEDGNQFSSTTVNIFFKDTQFITSRRSELYGRTDFLANCGGLLGLFMGFSVLSLVEILYHCSIHIFYKTIKWLATRNANKPRPDEKLEKITTLT